MKKKKTTHAEHRSQKHIDYFISDFKFSKHTQKQHSMNAKAEQSKCVDVVVSVNSSILEHVRNRKTAKIDHNILFFFLVFSLHFILLISWSHSFRPGIRVAKWIFYNFVWMRTAQRLIQYRFAKWMTSLPQTCMHKYRIPQMSRFRPIHSPNVILIERRSYRLKEIYISRDNIRIS